MIHGAELRVHFLKSFRKGSPCENHSQKGLKIKKTPLHVRATLPYARPRWRASGFPGGRMCLPRRPAAELAVAAMACTYTYTSHPRTPSTLARWHGSVVIVAVNNCRGIIG
jgi:hypothetical protein